MEASIKVKCFFFSVIVALGLSRSVIFMSYEAYAITFLSLESTYTLICVYYANKCHRCYNLSEAYYQ